MIGTNINETKYKDEIILKKVENSKKIIGPDESEQLESKCKDLEEIFDYLRQNEGEKEIPKENIFAEIIDMVYINLFRRLPHKEDKNCLDPLGEEMFPVDPVWESTCLVYLILKTLICLDSNEQLLRSYISERFMQQLFELFDSEDIRERDKLKVILHRLYCKMYVRRPFVRKKIKELLLRHIYDNEQIVGINELLQLYGTIVTGFSIPLREEHRVFLEKVLIPLHKAEDLEKFHTYLTYCVVQFLYKEECLATIVLSGILKYWPKTNSKKEVLFLKEVGDILDMVDPEEFKKIQRQLFSQISISIGSLNFQVAEKALSFWQNEKVLMQIIMNHTTLMPIVLPALMMIRREHWNQTITNRIYDALRAFKLMDPQLFQNLVHICLSTIQDIRKTDVTMGEEVQSE